MKRPEILWYDFQNGITNKEKNVMFTTKPKLLSIGIISLVIGVLLSYMTI